MKREKPNSNEVWLNDMYKGSLYRLKPSRTTALLAQEVNGLLTEAFKVADIFKVHEQLLEDQFFNAMKVIRRSLFEDKKFIELLRGHLLSLGFDKGSIAFEPLRLRAIRHDGHLNERAKAVYYPHRDTWYGHEQNMIVGWIPLHDQKESQTFEIYPEYLGRVVPNNSEVFNYDEWRESGKEKKIGWQKKSTGLTATYPSATASVRCDKVINFSANTSEALYFSGAHFHKTLEQSMGATRFSVDFRFVNKEHSIQNIGAVNVDNRSRGSATQDYHIL